MMEIANLVRPNIRKLVPYSSARSEFKGKAEVFLDANENPFETGLNRYPDPLQWKLKAAISQLKAVPAEQIFLGNGSDEAIDLVVRIFCEPRQDHILILPPTYGMYQVSADIADVGLRSVSLTPDFQPDVDAILAAADEHSKILFICSPNNPTGNDVELERIRSLCAQFKGIVVVDEAYIDFSNQASCTSLLPEFPNLIVLQTFSKAWGMAGIRLGMAFASIEIIQLFNKVKPPYNINQLTQQIALEALETSQDDYQQLLSTLLSERERLIKGLGELKFVEKIFPSDANFILVKMDDPNGTYQYLVEEGIIVRNRNSVHLCAGSLRITVGRPEENDALLTALNKRP
ncbi:histidinol-phosphate transaminase [Haliscomenobacter sp.]|uniref:histidinol-phosphate transaminase n=1 Tax=Haliscomenobacter sp. TaxID=2717303 RepID=UPI003594758A